jgi:hypothetical protein
LGRSAAKGCREGAREETVAASDEDAELVATDRVRARDVMNAEV